MHRCYIYGIFAIFSVLYDPCVKNKKHKRWSEAMKTFNIFKVA